MFRYTIQGPCVQRGALLRVPTSWVHLGRQRRSLTIKNAQYWEPVSRGRPPPANVPKYLILYKEASGYIEIPRHAKVYWNDEGYVRARVQGRVFDLRGPRGDQPVVSHSIDWRSRMQAEAGAALMATRDDKILALAPGGGKGLPDTSKVLTPSGWVRVSSVRVGDLLVGSDGTPTKVLGVYPQGMRPCYKIAFSDGTSVICDDQHLWSLSFHGVRRVLPADELAKRHYTPESTAPDGRRFALQLVSPVVFSGCTSPLPIDPWLLGMYLGDGTWRSVSVHTPEKDLLERMRQAGGRLVFPTDRCPYAIFTKTDILREQLSKLGLAGLGSHQRFIPREYLRASVPDRVALLQGLMDSDGYVVRPNGTALDYSTSSPLLAKCVADLVRALGGIAHQAGVTGSHYKKHGVVHRCRPRYRIRIQFPSGDVTPVSSRKHLKAWASVRPQRQHKYVDRIDAVGPRRTTCFAVDAIDELFVTKGYNLTHNTVVALRSAVEGKRLPALVIVHTQALLSQWVERATQFLGSPPIGHIQQDILIWEGMPLAVGMLHTLIRRKFPPEFYAYWNLIIADEVHNLGALTFSVACSLFSCERWGLSATLSRKDGMDRVVQMHMGEVAYEDLSQPLKPIVYFVHTGITLDDKKYKKGRSRYVSLAKMISDLSNHVDRNRLIIRWIEKSVDAGRTVLVLGERLEQLHHLCATCPAESKAVYVGSMAQEERTDALSRQIVFATQHLAKEGLDRPEFDTLFLLFPFSGAGRLRQSVGRILRLFPDKKQPKVFVFLDMSSVLLGMAAKMQQNLMDLKFQYKVVRYAQ